MHTRTTLLALAFALPVALCAQDVQRCCGTSNSTFLLGNTSFAPHTQSLYLPGDLQNEVSGLITTLYFRYGSTGEDLGNTLTGLMIRLGMTTAGAFTSNTFFTDLDTVLMAPTYTIAPGTEGNWFSIPPHGCAPPPTSRTCPSPCSAATGCCSMAWTPAATSPAAEPQGPSPAGISCPTRGCTSAPS